MSIYMEKAAFVDADTIAEIYAQARRSLAALGIDQWQNGYPSAEVTSEDIEKGRLYVCRENGEILGVLALIADGEPTYDKIYDGEWLTDGKYLAVHRIAVNTAFRRRGTASFMLSYAKAAAKALGMRSVRIDTHEGNAPMRQTLCKNGFTYCGIIYLTDGDRRAAYEYTEN